MFRYRQKIPVRYCALLSRRLQQYILVYHFHRAVSDSAVEGGRRLRPGHLQAWARARLVIRLEDHHVDAACVLHAGWSCGRTVPYRYIDIARHAAHPPALPTTTTPENHLFDDGLFFFSNTIKRRRIVFYLFIFWFRILLLKANADLIDACIIIIIISSNIIIIIILMVFAKRRNNINLNSRRGTLRRHTAPPPPRHYPFLTHPRLIWNRYAVRTSSHGVFVGVVT